ncbi:MAG: class I SAM-dependent methyltransferase [Proteobacteria bacterium]|nr:class I SAM-dependent methyltransferase [Pseudomonadota bacterium]
MLTDDTLKKLADNNIHAYGSRELLKFERQLSIYFEREYQRWHGNKKHPEEYGISSFEGEVADKTSDYESVEHYNNELRLYQAFLDPRFMAYTMADFGATDERPEIDGGLSLEQAQIKKFELIIQRADIRDGQKVLDLGCGFGGFIRYLLEKFPNIQLTGINPSTVQAQYIKDRSRNSNRLNIIDHYIDQIEHGIIADGYFDRVISIGVLEHISNLDALFEHIAPMLKTGGKCLHHIIVSRDTIPQFLSAEDTMMAEYFPGGHIWPYEEMRRHDRHLKFVDSWFINGMNYWKTLDEWHRNLWQSLDDIYPSHLAMKELDHWNRYFSLSKAMFIADKGRSYGNAHYLFEKR